MNRIQASKTSDAFCCKCCGYKSDVPEHYAVLNQVSPWYCFGEPVCFPCGDAFLAVYHGTQRIYWLPENGWYKMKTKRQEEIDALVDCLLGGASDKEIRKLACSFDDDIIKEALHQAKAMDDQASEDISTSRILVSRLQQPGYRSRIVAKHLGAGVYRLSLKTLKS